MFSRCALTCPAGCRSLRRSPTGSGWPLCDLQQPPRAAPTCRRSRQRSHPPRTGSTCRPPEKKRRAEIFKLPDQCFSFSFRHVSALTFPQRSKHTKHKVTSRCLCCSDPQTSLCVTLCHFASFVSQSSVFLFRRSELKTSYLLRKALLTSSWFSVFRPRRRCSLCLSSMHLVIIHILLALMSRGEIKTEPIVKLRGSWVNSQNCSVWNKLCVDTKSPEEWRYRARQVLSADPGCQREISICVFVDWCVYIMTCGDIKMGRHLLSAWTSPLKAASRTFMIWYPCRGEEAL